VPPTPPPCPEGKTCTPPPPPPPGDPDEDKEPFKKCYSKWQFSALFADTSLHSAIQFLEVGSEVSLMSDVNAARYKLDRPGMLGTNNPYASGINRGVRAVSTGAMRGALTQVGNVLTPALAVTAVFTGSYNATIAVQCGTGILD
jgi:hypothetical protein